MVRFGGQERLRRGRIARPDRIPRPVQSPGRRFRPGPMRKEQHNMASSEPGKPSLPDVPDLLDVLVPAGHARARDQ